MGNSLFRAKECIICYDTVPKCIVIDRPKPGEGYYLDARLSNRYRNVYTRSRSSTASVAYLPKVFYTKVGFKTAIINHTEFIKETEKYSMLQAALKPGEPRIYTPLDIYD